MRLIFLSIFLVYSSTTKEFDPEKQEFCNEVEECVADAKPVCGIRQEGDQFHLKTFADECELLKFGCQVEDDKEAYGIINLEYCVSNVKGIPDSTIDKVDTNIAEDSATKLNLCTAYNCANEIGYKTVCGIRQRGVGFIVRLFTSECELEKYNCENNLTFSVTDRYICDGVDLSKESRQGNQTNKESVEKTNATEEVNTTETANNNETETTISPIAKIMTDRREYFGDNGTEMVQSKIRKPTRKNLIVVDGSMFNTNDNINDTIDNFFSATHVFDMPMKEMNPGLNESARRVMVRIFGPVIVFKPWVHIPKNISYDAWHQPTLSSCFHKCPVECPDTYAPVCGVPGIMARQPSLMFKNHCFMDAAQCKMRWDNDSWTSISSSYIESSFLFCLSDVLNGLYRFLPLVRTLQHMGRLKRKGRFRTRLRNMRFFNELLKNEGRVMG